MASAGKDHGRGSRRRAGRRQENGEGGVLDPGDTVLDRHFRLVPPRLEARGAVAPEMHDGRRISCADAG